MTAFLPACLPARMMHTFPGLMILGIVDDGLWIGVSAGLQLPVFVVVVAECSVLELLVHAVA